MEREVLVGERTHSNSHPDGLFWIFLFEHNLNYTPLLTLIGKPKTSTVNLAHIISSIKIDPWTSSHAPSHSKMNQHSKPKFGALENLSPMMKSLPAPGKRWRMNPPDLSMIQKICGCAKYLLIKLSKAVFQLIRPKRRRKIELFRVFPHKIAPHL